MSSPIFSSYRPTILTHSSSYVRRERRPSAMARECIVFLARSREIVLLLTIFLHAAASSNDTDAKILLKFKNSLKNADALSGWDNGQPPCQGDKEMWNGVLCQNGDVWGLQLENMGLGGDIDVDTLSEMRNLIAISLMNNNFEGSLPNLTRLSELKTMYLSNNKFSGDISPDIFAGMSSLKKIYLANNKFSGRIPASLAAMPKLKELSLENNRFEGEIPNFPPDTLKLFNVSNNLLMGVIPDSLKNINASAFSGNEDLCGPPLKSCSSPKNVSFVTIIIVVLPVAAALAALVVVVIILCRRKQTPQEPKTAAYATPQGQSKPAPTALDGMEQGQSAAVPSAPDVPDYGKKAEQNVKLTFVKDDTDNFDMSDLLKASAEVLGSGMFGSTYKAALSERQVVVVKRFRHMNNVGKEEFHEHMRRLGRLNHPNVLPIVAFYYRKEEKLFITECVDNVSLAVHLHGNNSRGLPSPNWPTRLKIVKGVAKGLKYLYDELPSLTTPHGHLKSPNVLLDGSYNPVLGDYGLVPVVNQEHAQEHMVSYKSPEYKKSGRVTKKTDVWSLGILILETLTGRFPANFLRQGSGGDSKTNLAAWVAKAVRDGGDAEVFDGNMEGVENCEGEMMRLLRIGLSCCDGDVERRPDIKEAASMIEEV